MFLDFEDSLPIEESCAVSQGDTNQSLNWLCLQLTLDRVPKCQFSNKNCPRSPLSTVTGRGQGLKFASLCLIRAEHLVTQRQKHLASPKQIPRRQSKKMRLTGTTADQREAHGTRQSSVAPAPTSPQRANPSAPVPSEPSAASPPGRRCESTQGMGETSVRARQNEWLWFWQVHPPGSIHVRSRIEQYAIHGGGDPSCTGKRTPDQFLKNGSEFPCFPGESSCGDTESI